MPGESSGGTSAQQHPHFATAHAAHAAATVEPQAQLPLPRLRLHFSLMNLSGSGLQLISTSSTLRNQALALPHASTQQASSNLPPLPPLPSIPRPPWARWPWARRRTSLEDTTRPWMCAHSLPADTACHIKPAASKHNTSTNVVHAEQSPAASSDAWVMPKPTTHHPKRQRQASVAWARLPFSISSPDPGEKAAVGYLLYQAEKAELELAREVDRQKQAKREKRLRKRTGGLLPYPSSYPSDSVATHERAASVESGKWAWLSKPWSWARRRTRGCAPQQSSSYTALPKGRAPPPPDLAPSDLPLWEAFQLMDVDGNGTVDRDELGASLSRRGLPSTNEFVNDLMAEYDEDKNNTIDFSEFKRCAQKREQMVRKAFRSIDSDGNGVISVAEIQNVLRKANLPCSSEREAERMMRLLDDNKDRNVSFTEFRDFVSLLPASQVSSTNHMLYAWANSSLWLDQDMKMVHQVTSPDEPYQRLLAGGLSGVISRTIIAPIERLRTLMMLSREPAGFATSCRSMWADGGLRGLWKGHMSTVIKVFPCSAIQFGVVDSVKKIILKAKGLDGHITQLECFLAGCLAGGVACIVSHPLDTIRTQQTAALGRTTIIGVARAIGLSGLYRGFGLSCLQEVLGNGIGFMAVDIGSKFYRTRNEGRGPSPQKRGLIAALAASVVMTCVMPLDVVVKRLQVQGCPGHPILYTGPMDAFRKIANEEGLGAFYRGMMTTYMKTAPSMGAVYFFYDRISHMLGIGGLNRYRLTM